MKKTTGIFLLALYAMSVVRPVLPLIDYWINYDYIRTVLCINKDKPELKCNGTCHLNKELAESAKTDEGKPESLPQTDLQLLPILCPEADIETAEIWEWSINSPKTGNEFLRPQFHPHTPSPPPKLTL